MTKWLAKEQQGKHPALDRFIALSLDHIEHFRIVSVMSKKVGAPKIALITDTAKTARDRVIAAGFGLDAAAREIAAWPSDVISHDDPKSVAQSVTSEEFKERLRDHYAFFIGDMVRAYERFAAKSWKYPNMIKFKSYRAWVDIPTNYLQQDRARLSAVSGLDDKSKKQFLDYLETVQKVVDAYRNSFARYVANKSDTWAAKDPYSKPLIAAQKAWQRRHARFIGSKRAAGK